jgi:hypothetical protein
LFDFDLILQLKLDLIEILWGQFEFE